MLKKFMYLAIILQIVTLVLVLIGISFNRNSQNGATILYLAFSIQIIILILVVYLGYKRQQKKIK